MKLRLATDKIMMTIRHHWPFVFLLAFVVLIILAFSSLHTKNTVITHFGDRSFEKKTDKMEPVGWLNGQVTSNCGGFVAGEELTVYAVLWLRTDQWQRFRQLFPAVGKKTIIEGSERVDDYLKDFPRHFAGYGMDSIIFTPGTIPLVEVDDSSRTAVFNGRVAFTCPGNLRFGNPLDLILEPLMMNDFGLEIAPRYILHQIEANKRAEALTYLTLAISCLAVFFAYRGSVTPKPAS